MLSSASASASAGQETSSDLADEGTSLGRSPGSDPSASLDIHTQLTSQSLFQAETDMEPLTADSAVP